MKAENRKKNQMKGVEANGAWSCFPRSPNWEIGRREMMLASPDITLGPSQPEEGRLAQWQDLWGGLLAKGGVILPM